MTERPTHWTDFDKLYNLPDPRPYFRGVETGDYRMPGIMAGVLARLMPGFAERRPDGGPVGIVDFAAGYGAVGLCLRANRTMSELYEYYNTDRTVAEDAATFSAMRRADLVPHRLDAIDIADVALDYALSCGAIDGGHTDNLISGNAGLDLTRVLSDADVIFECGAIGDHVAGAMDALLRAAAPNRPFLLISPRPRVDLAPLKRALDKHGYDLTTLLDSIRYRRPFSERELQEEIDAGLKNGLEARDCTIDGYFRVDLRLAAPDGSDIADLREAASGFHHDAL